jgi:cell division protein FtsN
LKARDIDARVVGKSKPFRVRIGRYETRADAAAAAKQLKARKIAATVTDIGSDDK